MQSPNIALGMPIDHKNFEPIDTRQIQIFVALAQGGSLKAAASKVGITQSAVSHAVSNLERDLDAKLFQRKGKGLKLTGLGKIFLPESINILRLLCEMRSKMDRKNASIGRCIRIACAHSFIQFAMPDILCEFQRCFPFAEIQLIPADRGTCIDKLEGGEVDAAILVNLPKRMKNLVDFHLFDDELKAVMSPEHKLAKSSAIPLHEFVKTSVYLHNSNSFTSHLVINEIHRRSFRCPDIQYVANPEALRELVKMKLGISLLPQWGFRAGTDRERFVWREIEGLNLKRSWHFAHLQRSVPDVFISTLVGLCKSFPLVREHRYYETHRAS